MTPRRESSSFSSAIVIGPVSSDPGTAPDAAPPAVQLRRSLEAGFPEYMVPSYILVLEALPLTPSGKVDRKALPPPEAPPETVELEGPSSSTACC